ncbi:restriction endonuclease [Domibacillus indicus]|uniref:restriction endonuclease n=1 Tax=Domibacillus indicus TaxID=1437523 RepID=UPI0020404AD3|nr:restriction endonuclease [Domibacillus indicus]MCM3788370.1 restriction endonuclease [Domibacillus indicus]
MSGRGRKGLGIGSDKILIYMLYAVVLIVILQHIEVFIGYTILVALLAIPYFLLRWYTKDKKKQQFLQSGLNELDSMDSVQFKEYVGALFESRGYAIEYTPKSGDYGADFILRKGNYSIAVQAKRYNGSAGVKAVQEASCGKAYYKTNEVWAVTNRAFTKNAYHCAEKLNVKLIDRNDLIGLLSENSVMAKPQETRPT